MVKKWPWPWILIYHHKLNQLSASINFQVSGCNSFWKIQCFHLSLNHQIWPCRKISQCQPKVIICTNYIISSNFWCNIPGFNKIRCIGSREDVFWRVYYHIWPWQPSWSCDQHHFTKSSFLCIQELTYKIWLEMAKWFLRKLDLSEDLTIAPP